MGVTLRPYRSADAQPLRRLLEATKVFRDVEIDVALELMAVCDRDPDNKDYTIVTAVDADGAVVGYYCAGPTPMTESTYDMYWIAVDPSVQSQGVGGRLLRHCEDFVAASGGSLIMVETSSLPKYDATRAFYVKHRYHEEAVVRDYYAPGDSLVIYSKHLKEAR